MYAVDINGKFKINATSNYILRIQRVDGTTLHDSFELSFNTVDKTSILTTNNVNLLQAINNTYVAVNVYSKAEVDTGLNLKAGKYNSYTRAEITTFIEPQYSFNGSFVKIVDPTTGKFRISLNSNIPITSSCTTRIDIHAPSQYGGSIRIIPALNNGNASIGYYNYLDARIASAGDVWICGVSCDSERGCTITTPV